MIITKQNKVEVDTLSIRKITFTEKSNKTKPQAGQEKFMQSKPDKPQS